MKNWVMGLSVLVFAFSLSACSSNYVMATKDGNMILTKGKPKLDKETGLLSYVDEKGTVHQINSDQLSQIIER